MRVRELPARKQDDSQSLGLRTLEDISSLILHSHDLNETLQNIVNLVARRTGSDVCSIYLLEKDGETLTLHATKGLSRSSVGKVRMNTSEGLTGLVVEKRGVVAIEDAPSHPRFKYFRETREERFHSFLGLPLFEHKSPTGVIVVQTKKPRTFSTEEISTLTTISNQISSIIITARLLDSVRKKEEERDYFERELQKLKERGGDSSPIPIPPGKKGKLLRMLHGIAVSPGFSLGKVSIIDRPSGDSRIVLQHIGSRQEEKKRFLLAVEKAKIQTLYLEKRVEQSLSREDAAIFHTHLMILEDRGFLTKVQDRIDGNCGAVRAVEDVVESYVSAFSRMEDPYLRERSADMKDIGRRIINCLTGHDRPGFRFRDKRILVAKEILPSDLAALDHTKISGIITGSGDVNSHASIMAKSLGIPTVIVGREEIRGITHRDEVIVDGNTGCVYINPDVTVKAEYERLQLDVNRKRQELEGLRDLPAVTVDGTKIFLRANIALLSDITVALAHGAEGVGLYRTEFPYMARSAFPDRNELFRLFRTVLEGFSPFPVTIRTLDIGGDKSLPYFPHPKEENPFMGWRSIRLSLERHEILREQLAGILMASTFGTVRLMFPLVSSCEEIRRIKEIVAETRQEVEKSGHAVADDIQLGIMIELPAAVQIANFLIREVDFFSIGTNDLIQYTLAADRNNAKVQQYYDPYHPAVLHSIKRVADCAADAGKPVSLCGEMASDPSNAAFLLGMGVTEFSLSAPSLPAVKQALRSISRRDAEEFAAHLLHLSSAAEIREQVRLFKERSGF
ncbi:MAG: phosphoenolpyruvate--protein phosphotransferase [Geobacteraceae bacterium]|nr:phosphoenolpyruvate--protein phosphotransferase [Geobacteraceae bacterium]